MENILFINRQSIVKVCVVWMLGLAVLLGSSGVSLALFKRFEANKRYCGCECANSTGFNNLYWEKVASCSLNGRKCTFNNPTNGMRLEQGTLRSCMDCVGDADGSGGALCTAKVTPGELSLTPGDLTIAPESGTSQSSPPLYDPRIAPKSQIQKRGVEGEKPAEPAPGTSGPSDPSSGTK